MVLRTKRLTLIAVLTAAGLVLGFVEAKIPVLSSVPGGKIGLANITSLISLYLLGLPCAVIVSLLRCFLLALLCGAPMSFLYSGTGALLSCTVMFFAKKGLKTASEAGVSILGAVAFNFGQTAVAAVVLSNINIMRYFPVLCVISAFSGAATGICAKGIMGAMKNV